MTTIKTLGKPKEKKSFTGLRLLLAKNYLVRRNKIDTPLPLELVKIKWTNIKSENGQHFGNIMST